MSDTLRLTGQDAARAADILAQGGLVAFPTETVYGLGANGLDSAAVAAIFEAKGRPQDNPLILHIPSAAHLERYCEDIPTVAYDLAGRFWPGPLTMILKRRDNVPDVVTAGLGTVGMRCPDHPVAQAVLELCQLPIAAPSANTSGRPSPTTAQAVGEDDNKNPKYGILTVKYYLQKAGFPKETTIELGGVEVGIYE